MIMAGDMGPFAIGVREVSDGDMLIVPDHTTMPPVVLREMQWRGRWAFKVVGNAVVDHQELEKVEGYDVEVFEIC
jgi:hypothetical protein